MNLSRDHYSFGSTMPGRQFSASSYRYGFNGKENDPESGTQDYGMRIYNSRLGRFLSEDPLTSKYPWYTPYQFAGNKPIIAIDMDGLEEIYITTTKGKRTIAYTYTEDDIINVVNGTCPAKRIHYDGTKAVAQFQGPNQVNEKAAFNLVVVSHEQFIRKRSAELKARNANQMTHYDIKAVPLPDPVINKKPSAPADIIYEGRDIPLYFGLTTTLPGADYKGNTGVQGGDLGELLHDRVVKGAKSIVGNPNSVKEIRIYVRIPAPVDGDISGYKYAEENAAYNIKKLFKENGVTEDKVKFTIQTETVRDPNAGKITISIKSNER